MMTGQLGFLERVKIIVDGMCLHATLEWFYQAKLPLPTACCGNLVKLISMVFSWGKTTSDYFEDKNVIKLKEKPGYNRCI